MSRVKERLDASACDWQKTVDALRQEFYSNAESLNNGAQSAAEELRRDLNSNAKRIACLDAWQQDIVPSLNAMQEAVSVVQPTLNKLSQDQFDAFDRRLSAVEGDIRSINFRAKIAEADASLQQKAAAHITEKFGPAPDKQKRRMTEPEAQNMEKVGGIENKLSSRATSAEAMRESMHNIKRALHDVTSKLNAPDGRHAEKPGQHSVEVLNWPGSRARIAVLEEPAPGHRSSLGTSQHPRGIQQFSRSPLPGHRILTGSSISNVQSPLVRSQDDHILVPGKV